MEGRDVQGRELSGLALAFMTINNNVHLLKGFNARRRNEPHTPLTQSNQHQLSHILFRQGRKRLAIDDATAHFLVLLGINCCFLSPRFRGRKGGIFYVGGTRSIKLSFNFFLAIVAFQLSVRTSIAVFFLQSHIVFPML
jgi:hypothetical protein